MSGVISILKIAANPGVVVASHMREAASGQVRYVEVGHHDWRLEPIRYGCGGTMTCPKVLLRPLATVCNQLPNWTVALQRVLGSYEGGWPAHCSFLVEIAADDVPLGFIGVVDEMS